MIDDILLEAEDKMDKTVEAARHEFGNIRTGRANAGMFEQLLVDYYGAPTPMQQLASFQIPEARTVLISPFDRTATQEIIKTLRESDLGVNPTDDGNVVRVVLPALTEERRKEYVKQAKNKAEDARVSVRSIRRKAKEALDRLKKDGDAGEDEVERAEKALESATKARGKEPSGSSFFRCCTDCPSCRFTACCSRYFCCLCMLHCAPWFMGAGWSLCSRGDTSCHGAAVSWRNRDDGVRVVLGTRGRHNGALLDGFCCCRVEIG